MKTSNFRFLSEQNRPSTTNMSVLLTSVFTTFNSPNKILYISNMYFCCWWYLKVREETFINPSRRIAEHNSSVHFNKSYMQIVTSRAGYAAITFRFCGVRFAQSLVIFEVFFKCLSLCRPSCFAMAWLVSFDLWILNILLASLPVMVKTIFSSR